MRVVLPIAAIVAILIAAAAVSGGTKLTDRAPVDLEPAAPAAAEPYPVSFDPYTGWGVAELPVTAEPGREAAVPYFEVDPFDRYGVSTPRAWEAMAAPNLEGGSLVPLVTFADVRAWYGDDPLADALPATSAEPVAMAGPATDAWWSDTPPPLDAK